MSLQSHHITIIGTGQLGCSLGAALRESDYCERVRGYDLAPAHSQQAAILGAVDEVAESLVEACQHTDVIILCSPLHTMEDMFQTIGQHAKEGTVVSDVGSVKAPLLALAKQHMPKQPFIPGHPIAGTEKSGPLAINPELYRHRKYILTPDHQHDLKALTIIQRLWEDIGAKVEVLDAKRHDRIYGQTSHFAQLLAWVHAGLLSNVEGIPNNSYFYSFVRIGGSDMIMWLDIFLSNANYLLEASQRYAAALHQLHTPEAITATDHWRQEARTLLHPEEWSAPSSTPERGLDVMPVFSALAYTHATMGLEEIIGESLYPFLGAGFYGITRPAAVEAKQASAMLDEEQCETLARQLTERLTPFQHAIEKGDRASLLDLINGSRNDHFRNLERWGMAA